MVAVREAALVTTVACVSCGKTLYERDGDWITLRRRSETDQRQVVTRLLIVRGEIECHREVFTQGRWRVCRALNTV